MTTGALLKALFNPIPAVPAQFRLPETALALLGPGPKEVDAFERALARHVRANRLVVRME